MVDLPTRETMTVEFKSDEKRLPDRELRNGRPIPSVVLSTTGSAVAVRRHDPE